MKLYRLQTRQWLPRSRDEVFRFFSDPRNLQRLTPPWLHFEILTPESIDLKACTVLNYKLKVRGFPLRWQSEIASWEPPSRFVDRQIQGPYRLWVHEHTFVEENHGTLVGDNVTYSVLGGRIIQKILVAPDLERIFSYRRRMLQNLFNCGE